MNTNRPHHESLVSLMVAKIVEDQETLDTLENEATA